MRNLIGIEIGGTKLQVVAGNAGGAILGRRSFTVERARGAAGIRQQLEQGLRELASSGTPKAVGVGFGGPVDWKTARICRSHHIEGWSEFDLGEWLQELTGAPVLVDNDANVAALGEARRGAGVGFDPVFYVTLGSGVGGGLVLGGEIYHGALPGEAELGHVRLDRSGTTVESRCSGWAVDAKIRALATKQPSSLLAKLIHKKSGAEAKHLTAALKQGDAVARTILEETATDLAFGLSHVTHLFHPQAIILGGGLSSLGEPLRTAVERALTGFIMEAFQPGPKITLSALREDAVPVGALELANVRQ
jgi:glucokinase